MLFDLQGRRKRLIQVIYAFLAILLGGSLVLLGTGSGLPGGLSSDGSVSGQDLSGDLEDARTALEADPSNPENITEILALQRQIAQREIEDEDIDGAISAYEDALDTWDNFLQNDLDNKADEEELRVAAVSALQIYGQVLGVSDSPSATKRRIRSAAQTADLSAEGSGAAQRWIEATFYHYLAEDDKSAERAEKAAQSLVPKNDDTAQEFVDDGLRRAKRQAENFLTQLELIQQTETGGADLDDPVGDLDLGTGDPAAPGAGGNFPSAPAAP